MCLTEKTDTKYCIQGYSETRSQVLYPGIDIPDFICK